MKDYSRCGFHEHGACRWCQPPRNCTGKVLVFLAKEIGIREPKKEEDFIVCGDVLQMILENRLDVASLLLSDFEQLRQVVKNTTQRG